MTDQKNAGAIVRLEPVAYARKHAGVTVFLHTTGVCPDDGGMSALVLQSDALAKIAALEAEIARLREVLAAERERCAREAVHIGESWDGTELSPTNTAHNIAHAIRNLGAAP